MKKTILFLLTLLSAPLFAAGKPAAVFGHPSDVSRIMKDVLKPVGIVAVTPQAWPKAGEFSKYSVIYMGESLAKGAKYDSNIENFVKNGGILIFGGGSSYDFTGQKRSLAKAANFTGFAYTGNASKVKVSHVKFKNTPTAKALDFANQEITWNIGFSSYPAKLKSAEVVAETVAGKQTLPAIIVNRVGKGEVWWVSPMYFRFVQRQTNTGYADDEGRFILTESGKNIESLKKLYRAIFRRAKNLAVEDVKKSSWGTVPLGKQGNLKYDGKFKNKPTYAKAPRTFKPKFKLSENGKALAQIVITDKTFRYQAAELKYHLDAITGGKFTITSKRNPQLPAIVFEKGNAGRVVIKTTDNTVTLSGETAMAYFYILEKFGCRYIWPGKLGKIIPKEPTLWMQDIQMDVKPMLAMRKIRAAGGGGGLGERGLLGMKRCGITDPKAAAKARSAAYIDHPRNSSFFRWHGNGGSIPYGWGHAFGYLYPKYGKTNPEFFALQPDGTRSQAASPDRCRLCMSNPGLIKAIAKDLIAKFKKSPNKKALSICLNDGGRARFCMCEECRKLDPVNAFPAKMSFNVQGLPISVNYVQLTDRVIEFGNRITAELNKVLPDKGVSLYIYSCYSAAPVAVKPDPKMVLFSTTMNYINDKSRANSLKTLASLSSFGNVLFWRPNALRGFGNIAAPQNYARKMFDDTELFKFNNFAGMDFDCNEGAWSGKGLIYYALCKALWNPDRLTYDEIVDDYCRAGFGSAAPQIKKYFTELENIFNQASAKGCDYCEVFTVAKIAELENILADAANATDDEIIKERIQFLKYGLDVGKFSTRLYDARKANDNKTYKALQKEYRKFLGELAFKSPLSLSMSSTGFNTRYLAR